MGDDKCLNWGRDNGSRKYFEKKKKDAEFYECGCGIFL